MTANDDLFSAIDAGNADEVHRLVANDPDVAGARDRDGVSAVMHALYRGQRPIAEALAEQLPGLDVFEAASLRRAEALAVLLAGDPLLARAWSTDGFTPLHYAAFFGGGDEAELLLRAGADPDLRSTNDFAVMPIHSAVAGRHGDVVTALLDAGADPNVRQRHGWTPLHGAAQNDDAGSVDRLVAAGAAPDATNDEGLTPADVARDAGHDELALRLERAAGVAPRA
jgi:ankyrin repeat protein